MNELAGAQTLFDVGGRWLFAWSQTQPRMLAMFSVLPLFSTAMTPMAIRVALAAGFGFFAAPLMIVTTMAMPTAAVTGVTAVAPAAVAILAWVLKEGFVGFVLGFAFAMPFWMMEAFGNFIDNQRGASIGGTLDPLTGNDASPLGALFLQAFTVYLVMSGGLQIVLRTIYDSFVLWPAASWYPILRASAMPAMLGLLNGMIRYALTLAAPVMIVMFMAEIGLALINRFVPQLQVFFIAMPVKSALAFFILVLYAATLFDEMHRAIAELVTVLPFLNKLW